MRIPNIEVEWLPQPDGRACLAVGSRLALLLAADDAGRILELVDLPAGVVYQMVAQEESGAGDAVIQRLADGSLCLALSVADEGAAVRLTADEAARMLGRPLPGDGG